MTASMPHVGRPATRKATMGKVPAPPRPARAGPRPDPVHWSSMPAGAEGRLGQAGQGATLSDQRGLLVAGDAADGRCARERGRQRRRDPTSRRPRGSMASGIASCSSNGSFHPRVAGSTSAGHGGVGGVGDVERVGARARPRPTSVQATQVSTVPKHSSPASALVRSGSTSSRMAITLVADALGASRMPSALERQAGAHGPQVLPADARGRPASPWPAPTRWSRPAGWRYRRPPPGRRRPERGVRHLEDGLGHARGVELHQARGRRVGEQRGRWCSCSTVASGRTMAARTPEVPTSTTRMLPPAVRSWPGRRSEGRGEAELCPG